MRQVEYALVLGNVTTYAADVLALKYAHAFYGATATVANALVAAGVPVSKIQPEEGESALIPGTGAVKAAQVLFIGTPDLGKFRYEQIKKFGRDVLIKVAHDAPIAAEIAMTLHGVGYGLDEVESCLSQFDGCVDALLSQCDGVGLQAIRRISIIESNPSRITRLQNALLKHVMATDSRVKARQRGAGEFSLEIPDTLGESVGSAKNISTAERGHAFVAMPFSEHMKDVFYYGIQGPIRNMGLICERMDHEAFTGDIVQWLRERIASASIVVADLTGANPNVYLEVGYAWGKGKPVVLVANASEELAFDVRGHKRLAYSSIHDLEEKLEHELKALREAHRI